MLLITSLVIGWIMSTVWLLVFYYLKKIELEKTKEKLDQYQKWKDLKILKNELLRENFEK